MAQRNKIIIGIFFYMILVSTMLISAETIYSGESITFNLPETPDKCEFSENAYDLEGINYTINGNQVTIIISPNFKSDTLIFKCFVGKEEPVHYSFGGGGSSSSTTTTQENQTDDIKDNTENDIDNDTFDIDEEKKNKGVGTALIILFVIIIVVIIIALALENSVQKIIGIKKKNNKKNGEELTQDN